MDEIFMLLSPLNHSRECSCLCANVRKKVYCRNNTNRAEVRNNSHSPSVYIWERHTVWNAIPSIRTYDLQTPMYKDCV